jgi:hypothetical protein
MRVIIFAIVLIAPLNEALARCGAPELAADVQIPTTFIYEKGWAIPGLIGAAVIRHYRDESGGEVTEYKPMQVASVDLQGFELSHDGKSLRLVPGYAQLVERIQEYRVQDRIYAYSVTTVSSAKADPPMWPRVRNPAPERKKTQMAGVLGCGWTTLRYFDADGDGTFESLEYVGFGGPHSNATQCPTVPLWALKLLPNRTAAERCLNEERKKLEMPLPTLPSSLNELFNQKRLLPVLAPQGER